MAADDLRLVPDGGGLYACVTLDDIAAGDGPRLPKVLSWLDELDVPGTFFAIPYSDPNQATLYEDKELLDGLRAAREAGHEVQPHGYDHELFESGLPDLLAVRDAEMMSKIARTLSREEFQLRHQHTQGWIGGRLERAVRVFEESFGGRRPTGYRSGYHEFCRAMYSALEDLGVRWSSSRTATPLAWRPQVEAGAEEVTPWVGLHPYWVGGVLELPHLADYGTHIPAGDVAAWVDLARRHLTLCREAGAPFICVAHHHGLSCYGDPPEWKNAGYEAHTRVIELAREEFGAHYVTMSGVADAALAKPAAWLKRDEYRR